MGTEMILAYKIDNDWFMPLLPIFSFLLNVEIIKFIIILIFSKFK